MPECAHQNERQREDEMIYYNQSPCHLTSITIFRLHWMTTSPRYPFHFHWLHGLFSGKKAGAFRRYTHTLSSESDCKFVYFSPLYYMKSSNNIATTTTILFVHCTWENLSRDNNLRSTIPILTPPHARRGENSRRSSRDVGFQLKWALLISNTTDGWWELYVQFIEEWMMVHVVIIFKNKIYILRDI